MQRVKLFAVPGFVRVGWQAGDRDLFQRPLVSIQSHPNPVLVLCRITKGAAVRCGNFVAVVAGLVRIVMTTSAAGCGRFGSFEIRAAMFGVTCDTTNAGGDVFGNYRRHKTFRAVTRGTTLFHVPGK